MLPPDARRTLLPSLALSLSLLTLAGCGGDKNPVTPPDGPAALALVSSATALSGTAGKPLVEPVAVRVTSAKGKGISGVMVTFTIVGNSGSVSSATSNTNADGVATTIWTLGTVAGVDVDTLRASINQLQIAPLIIPASASAAAPAKLSISSGNNQTGSAGQPLTQPLSVVASDAYDNPTSGVVVSWTVEGGGTLSAATTTTNSDGLASVVWTLGTGENRAHATASFTTVPVTFSASPGSSGTVTVTMVSPDRLVEGQSATVTGTGFSTTLADNIVLIDGVPATITSATATALQVTVPTFDCRPARRAGIRVNVKGDVSNTFDHPVAPAKAPLSVALGQQLILSDPADFCLQFAESAEPEAYLIGVQSTSPLVTSMTPATLSAVASARQGAAMVAAPLQPQLSRAGGAPLATLTTTTDDHWERHRAAEGDLRTRERQLLGPLARNAAARRRGKTPGVALSVAATASVGDTVAIRFPDLNGGDFCNKSIPITTVVRAVGSRGIWLEDVANPGGGYTTADFQSMSDLFDNTIYAANVEYFGTPTDYDGNGRVVIVTSKEVNKVQNTLGFVVSSDLVPPTYCPASNDGEFYYGRAPDPTGLYTPPAPYSLDRARKDAPFLIAHEFAHVIQFGRRLELPDATAFQTAWEAEGQATFAEEVVGHRYTGRTSGQNYGADVAFNSPALSPIDWYSNRFVDLAIYFGFQSQTSKAVGAPEQCSWLGRKGDGNDGPCLGGREVYGVPALFLRWLTDQFGPTFPGGEQGLHRALIDNTKSGFATISEVTGTPMDVLLAQFAAMLYVDGRLPGANARLTMQSWDLNGTYNGIYTRLAPTAQLTPRERLFTSFTDAVTVRAGSTAYFRISGMDRGATAVRVRDAADAPLPQHMRFWVVRVN